MVDKTVEESIETIIEMTVMTEAGTDYRLELVWWYTIL